jgi:hypothetical protein
LSVYFRQEEVVRGKEHSDTGQVVLELREASLLFVAEKKENSPCRRGEEIDNHLIQRRKGKCPEEGVGKCSFQK